LVPDTGATSARRGFLGRCIRSWKHALALAIASIVISCTLLYIALHAWALYHFRSGRAALERHHGYEALPHFQAALRVWPKDPETLILASRAARQLGIYDEAGRYLDAYREIYGNDDNLSLEQVLLSAQQGFVEKVETFCRAKLAQDDPASSLILEAMARGYARRFQWNKAEFCLNQWLEREPDNPQAYFLKGFMEHERDNFQEAIVSYRRVLQLDPEQDEARLQLGELLLDLTQAEEARPHLEYLHRQKPGNVKAAVTLAHCYDLLGRQPEAEEILDDVLQRNPNHSAALFQRGRMALRAGQTAEAETFLRRACALEPGDFQAHYQLYQCLVQQNKDTEAQEMMPQLQQIDNDVKRIHDLATFQLAQSPHDPSLMYEAGVILLRAGADEEGVRWLQRALNETNDRHVPTHKALADYYQKKGNNRLAAQHREKAGGEGNP
jgi:tetratricopeptide (TPR) repeat protein